MPQPSWDTPNMISHHFVTPFKCSGTTWFDYSVIPILPITNHTKILQSITISWKQTDIFGACLLIQMSLEPFLLESLIYGTRWCWQGFRVSGLEGLGCCPGESFMDSSKLPKIQNPSFQGCPLVCKLSMNHSKICSKIPLTHHCTAYNVIYYTLTKLYEVWHYIVWYLYVLWCTLHQETSKFHERNEQGFSAVSCD